MSRRDTGQRGENLAAGFLKERGYQILETNYRCPHGEIDIVAQHNDCLVFIEVRSKKSRNFGSPEESITPAKKEHLIDSAWHYQQARGNLPQMWRIDFVAVELNYANEVKRIELFENAVGED